MTSLTRRLFLSRLGAAAPAVALMPAVTVAAVVTPGAEDAQLLGLGADIAPRLDTFRRASAALSAAQARYAELKPPVPDELIDDVKWVWAFRHQASMDERNYLDEPLPDRSSSRWIFTTDGIDGLVREHSINGRTAIGRKLRRLRALAATYEAEVDAAKDRSGVVDAHWARWESAAAVRDLVKRIAACRARTSAGTLIFARAFRAFAEIETVDDTWRWHGAQIMAPLLAAAVIDQAAAGSA